MKYRIVAKGFHYEIQYKTWLGWSTIENIAEVPMEFSSIENAEHAIDVFENQRKTGGVVKVIEK